MTRSAFLTIARSGNLHNTENINTSGSRYNDTLGSNTNGHYIENVLISRINLHTTTKQYKNFVLRFLSLYRDSLVSYSNWLIIYIFSSHNVHRERDSNGSSQLFYFTAKKPRNNTTNVPVRFGHSYVCNMLNFFNPIVLYVSQ